jgi:SAM-dependent methyltransferase
MPGDYRLYTDLADWWPLISPPEEYVQEAAHLAAVFGSATPPVREVLDLGSGGGGVAVHLKGRFALTLVDESEEMLAVSRRLNPECEHIRGDMRTIRLGRTFDAVLVHDAIDYMTRQDDLRQVIDTAYAHCRPGGLAAFVPDYTAETFQPATGGGGGARDATGRQASFREWTWDPDPADDWIQSEYEFTLYAADGIVEVVHEAHRLGAFRRGTWLRLLADAGFEPQPGPGDETAPAPGAGPGSSDETAPDAGPGSGAPVRGHLFLGRRPAG